MNFKGPSPYPLPWGEEDTVAGVLGIKMGDRTRQRLVREGQSRRSVSV